MKNKKFKINATYFDGSKNPHYHHFGINEMSAFLYGNKPEDIFELEMKVSENQERPDKNENKMETDYWAWFDTNKEQPSHLYPKLFLLNMIFPYGIKTSEEHGDGKAYRVELIKVIGQPYKK